MLRSEPAAGGYIPYLKDSIEKRNFIHDGPELRNQAQWVMVQNKSLAKR